MAKVNSKDSGIKLPSPHEWRTTDTDELNKRRLRAREESFQITNTDADHPIFSNFRVRSGSGLTYSVEVRDLGQRQFACDCIDFRINGLGSCKHVEAVLLQIEARFGRLYAGAMKTGSNRIEVVLDRDANTIAVASRLSDLPRAQRAWFDDKGLLENESPEEAVSALIELGKKEMPDIRISQEIEPWLELSRREAERKELRRDYEFKVQRGIWPPHETNVPLFPYQREGMLHLAFTERALLADEMGLGKTIQAIAACSLLHRIGKAQKVLIVTPASLKTEWEEQIKRFTSLPCRLMFGQRHQRLQAYADAPFFTVVNYEQMLSDALEVNQILKPDVVVLDEAQRIKNWDTKTAQAIKRLRSRYAFVLTGTPIENRIDEIHSLMDFLNPSALGPLFRFNREYYKLDERGRPSAYCNLDKLHARIKPFMLRRRKADVETELPARTDRNHFVPLSPEQKAPYHEHGLNVTRLIQTAKRRPLTKPEQDKLQRELAMMRMICDTNFILDPEDRICPKLAELEKILEECLENDAKVIVFSEWERMLQLVREKCVSMGIGFAWHTGKVPQLRRRAEINIFKSDPQCRVFLSTDSGSMGLNLQNASVVINCDLPWNPAKLEQRIARAWRKNQTKPVTVVNLVSEGTIEQRMLETLAVKQALADGVLELKGEVNEIPLKGDRQSFLARLEQLVKSTPAQLGDPESKLKAKPLPADRAMAFSQLAKEKIDGAIVRCEERFPEDGVHSVLVVVVERDAAQFNERLATLHEELFGPGKSDPLAPTRLEVIDRATDDAIQRLIAAGLIAKTTRASRPLFPTDENAGGPAPLSDEEKARAQAHRALASRKMKMARLLIDADLADEARPALLEAAFALGRALAVENRLPDPKDINDVLRPPMSNFLKETHPVLRQFVENSLPTLPPIVEQLEKLSV